LTYEKYRTYYPYMNEVSMTAARDSLADVIDSARTRHEPVSISRRGRRIAVVVDAEDYDRMVELAEDALDNAAADQAEADGEFIAWDEVRTELGWA
jgi:antitoxin Phd